MRAKALYELTPEHRARLPEWRDKWIGHAMRATPQTSAERDKVREHVRGLYEAAGLTPPPPERIVFVASPIVGAFAAGFAAWIWQRISKERSTRAATSAATYDATDAATDAATRAATSAATRDATRDATYAATDAATRDATYAATYDATRDATDAATRDATYDATRRSTLAATYAATRAATDAATRAATSDATDDATSAATRAATSAATYDATRDATDAATSDATYDALPNKDWFSSWAPDMRKLAGQMFAGDAQAALICASNHLRLWQGGNQWAGWSAYLSFFRHVAGLSLDYSKWDHFEQLSILSGPRWMHAEFCIVSDFPTRLTVDAQSRPHSDTGPFCRWADGFALYSIHGVRVPEWLFTHPERLTVEAIHAERNEEVRRIMVERYGLARYVQDAQFTVVHSDVDMCGQPRRLLRRGELMVVEVVNSTVDGDGTRRRYHIAVHPELRPLPLTPDGELGAPQVLTCHNAVASTFCLTGAEYQLAVET